jgi:hypothetical protein
LVTQAKPGLATSADQLRAEILSLIEALRRRPDVIVEDNPAFDPKWLDSVDRSSWKHWPNLKTFLLEHRMPPRAASAVASLENSSDEVMRMVGPATICANRRGLVLGYVQSGKTENFTSLAAKAADVGFKLIIVLSGIDDEIRRQTQLRFDQSVYGVGAEFSPDGVPFPAPPWNILTNADNDLITIQGADAHLTSSAVTSMVVKKNKTILERLQAWLAGSRSDVLNRLPVLVIDDEADQASLTNASSVDDPTEINRLIREILQLCKNSRYVAYTATPFANFFVNSNQLNGAQGNDLYPSDFILSLPTPAGYLGAADIYGLQPGMLRDGHECRPAGIHRSVPDTLDNGAAALGSAQGLRRAIMAFLLSTCALMRQRETEDIPCTMLAHVSQLNDDHGELAHAIRGALTELAEKAMSLVSSKALRNEFRLLYEEDFLVTHADIKRAGGLPVPDEMTAFDVIWPRLKSLLVYEQIEVRVVNSKQEGAPQYEGPAATDANLKAILVGGNLLSRGLTIPNLLCSYFLREPGHADTLLQMARWLGYRRDYVHLMRIYSTAECHDDFAAVAFAEQDVRNQIAEMRALGKTPREFAVRVRIRQGLMPTRRSVMQNVRVGTVNRNFAEQLLETRCFPEADLRWLSDATAHNQRKLTEVIQGKPVASVEGTGWKRITISSDKACSLIGGLRLHPAEPQFQTHTESFQQEIVKYIHSRREDGELGIWEIVICGLDARGSISPVTVAGISHIHPIQRGRETGGPGERFDRISNLGQGRDEYLAASSSEQEHNTKKGVKDTNGALYRKLRSPSTGRIFVYPISKHSNRSSGTTRTALFSDEFYESAPEFILGFGISFPGSDGAIAQSEQEFVNTTVSDTRS